MENSNAVELIGSYGGDFTHAQSAWTSTLRDLTPEKLNRIPEMLKSLADNGHHTPFEKSSLHFLVTCDTASHIHLIKHRIGVSINGESARYRELKDKAYIPTDWPPAEQQLLKDYITLGQEMYHKALKRLETDFGRKRAKESARFYLPYASQITMDVMFNFRSFMLFQKLRNDEHAQLEIRQIAQGMLYAVQGVNDFKHSLAAFGYV